MFPSFTSTYIQPMFPSYTHDVNLSKNPHQITLQDSRILNAQLQHDNLFSDHHSNYKTNNVAADHEQLASPQIIRASLQADTGKCSNNNGDDDGFNRLKNSIEGVSKASKNDRHSKINTARGPRDRRMRLSRDVAKKFFKLQDMLGFDKASKTVDWLLMKSESNIQELMIPHGKSSCESSTSKCELLSENINCDQQNTKSSSSSSRKEKKKTSRVVRDSSYRLRPLAKETREMARKRARERTKEKSSKSGCVSSGNNQILNYRPCFDQEMNQGVNCLGSWIINQPEQPLISSHFQFKQGIISDNSSSVIGNWNSASLFDYHHTGVHAHEHQFNDFQTLGNLWEGYN